MSANNQLVIIPDKLKSPKKWSVFDHDVESKSDGRLLGTSFTLEGAIRLANAYQKENVVEYGMKIIIE